jgi:hypothetical protein
MFTNIWASISLLLFMVMSSAHAVAQHSTSPIFTPSPEFFSNAKTSIKWKGYISESFHIEQGVRQGGILSADLYKIYVDPLLQYIG